MRWDGGGSHRLAGPGREQLILLNRLVVLNASSNTQQPTEQGRRLDAGPSACWSIQGEVLGAHLAGRP